MKMVVHIMQTGSYIDHLVSDVLKEFNITHIQFNILRVLEAAQPKNVAVGEILRGLMFPTSDVTRILDRLEKRELIKRSLCPTNRRKMDVSITQNGMDIITLSLPKITEKLNDFYSTIVNEQERDVVIDVLKRLKTQIN